MFKQALSLMLCALIVAGCGATASNNAQPSPATVAPATEPKATDASTNPTQKVTLVLDWFPNTNHSGIYVAQSKGWYTEQGLAVDIQAPSDPSASMKLVGSGNAAFGVSYQPAVEIARAQDVPVVSIAALVQHNLEAYASKKSKNITRPKDLEGKKFGTTGLAQVEPTLKTFMQCDQADVNKVEMVNVGEKLEPSLISDQVDATVIFVTWEGIEMEMQGVELNYIPQEKYCVPDVYTLVLMTNETLLKTQPEVARKFLAATAKGFDYAAKNPKEAADILLKAAPDLNADLTQRSQAKLSPQYIADAPRWGEQTLARWQAHTAWMASNKLLDKAIDPAQAFTNDYLPK